MYVNTKMLPESCKGSERPFLAPHLDVPNPQLDRCLTGMGSCLTLSVLLVFLLTMLLNQNGSVP